jgi:hypothetical protein
MASISPFLLAQKRRYPPKKSQLLHYFYTAPILDETGAGQYTEVGTDPLSLQCPRAWATAPTAVVDTETIVDKCTSA